MPPEDAAQFAGGVKVYWALCLGNGKYWSDGHLERRSNPTGHHNSFD